MEVVVYGSFMNAIDQSINSRGTYRNSRRVCLGSCQALVIRYVDDCGRGYIEVAISLAQAQSIASFRRQRNHACRQFYVFATGNEFV